VAAVHFAAQSPGASDNLLLIDSTPVERARSRETVKRSALAEVADYGWCASHSRFFWGPSPAPSVRSRRHALGVHPGLAEA
jgi:hypothetical protein